MSIERSRLPWTSALIGVALSVVACQSPGRSAPDRIVLARVNGVPLTLEDAMETFVSSHAGHGILVSGEPAVRELAGRLVEQQLLLVEAEVLGITEIEGLVQAVDTYRRKAAEIAFWRDRVDERMDVSEEEVEAFYAKSEDALNLFFVQSAEREEAEALRARVESGEDISELAAAESSHPSSEFGGMASGIQRGMLEPALEEAAFAIEAPGGLSPVVETEDGFVFVQLAQRLKNMARPEPSVALPQIRSVLESRRREELREEARAEVQRIAGLRVHTDEITKAALTGEGNPEVVVAEASGRTLSLAELREILNPGAIARASEEQAAAAGAGIAERWAMENAMDEVLGLSGHLEDDGVQADTRAFQKSAILGTLHRDYVYAGIEVTEADLRAHYEANRELYTRPAEFLPAYVVCATEEEAQDVLERARTGEDIGQLAMEHSIDRMSAAHGGQIGWLTAGDLLPEVGEQLGTLEREECAGPIETEIGFFVVKLLDQRDSVPIPYPKARDTLRRELTEARQAEARAEWAARLRDRADIELDEPGIRAASAWLQRQAEAQGKGDSKGTDAPAPPHGPAGGAEPPTGSKGVSS